MKKRDLQILRLRMLSGLTAADDKIVMGIARQTLDGYDARLQLGIPKKRGVVPRDYERQVNIAEHYWSARNCSGGLKRQEKDVAQEVADRWGLSKPRVRAIATKRKREVILMAKMLAPTKFGGRGGWDALAFYGNLVRTGPITPPRQKRGKVPAVVDQK